MWDCHINHYFGYWWKDIERRGLDQQFALLGWNIDIWDNEATEPDTEDMYWDELTREQQAAAARVCYNRDLWDTVPLPQWQIISDTSVPTMSPISPTSSPTQHPSNQPSVHPTTKSPSSLPTHSPTLFPTRDPSNQPTVLPTTKRPSSSPTDSPTTTRPSMHPRKQSSHSPTRLPITSEPTKQLVTMTVISSQASAQLEKTALLDTGVPVNSATQNFPEKRFVRLLMNFVFPANFS